MSEESIKILELTSNTDKVYCPCCGLKTLKAFKLPDQATIDYYIACLLTGLPFTKTYSLYNGRIIILITNLNDRLTTKALKVTNLINKANILLNIKQALGYLTYRLLPVKSIVINSVKDKKTYYVQDLIIKAMDKLISSDNSLLALVENYSECITSPLLFSNIPANMLDKTVGLHAHLVNSLINLGMNLSFYEGIQQE